ncbi:aminotransferase class V-fold PLP-dependent enzyme [Halomonas elongata]|uniref:pyridoxal phosphate-dependent decarboxylase family protein n=1 Tax=Halomonas elongata TaxID=2746 RepID=UPI003346A2D1
MATEPAECGKLEQHLQVLGRSLDRFLTFQHPDAMHEPARWRSALERRLPDTGIGIDAVMEEMTHYVIPNGSAFPNPGSTAFITTGATTISALATLAGAVASPQRLSLNAFNFLEAQSLNWLAQLFRLPADMQGLYTSGGSVANLVALGAARQRAFEDVGVDPARQGVEHRTRVFASEESHHSILRACAVLGLGRDALVPIPCDAQGRMRTELLAQTLEACEDLPVAIVGNLGTTNAGAIDPIIELARIARENRVWLHLDGAYGLPGMLDPDVRPLFDGLEWADSVVVDPHKWLGAPVGIGAVFVRDRALLQRAFTQEAAAYYEGSLSDDAEHSMNHMGIPYSDMGIELSAPSRGAVVWALLREIGVAGLAARIQRHNAMARWLAEQVQADPHLELLRTPRLSICCFRYVDERIEQTDELNRQLHHRLLHNNRNLPSTTLIDGKLALRPCFIGARTGWPQVQALLEEVRETGAALARQWTSPSARDRPERTRRSRS